MNKAGAKDKQMSRWNLNERLAEKENDDCGILVERAAGKPVCVLRSK